MVDRNIQLCMITKSDLLFNVIVESSTSNEKQFMIDIQAGREVYEVHKIDKMGWKIQAEASRAD